MPMVQRERHRAGRVGWLRAAVMGANDGILSTSSLVLGVAAAHATRNSIVVAGVAGLVAGAMAMAAGEYVSVHSQADTEKADLKLERTELETDYEGEHDELAAIYVARGVADPLGRWNFIGVSGGPGSVGGAHRRRGRPGGRNARHVLGRAGHGRDRSRRSAIRIRHNRGLKRAPPPRHPPSPRPTEHRAEAGGHRSRDVGRIPCQILAEPSAITAKMGPMPRPPVVSGRILIVDDDERQRVALSAMLSDCNFETQLASDGQEALERLASFNADVIVTDLIMPRVDGFALLRLLKERGDLTPAIVLTGFGSIEKALSAVHDLKAFWFLEKPVEPRAFKTLLERAIDFKRSLHKADELRRDLSLRGVLGNLVGTSPAMQQIFALIRQVGPTSAPVLICGESGTGKELVAREIHNCSPRAHGPFVAINAAALPETLIETELFGHEKGAFTGAMDRSAGCFEQAHGGTLLLDEIGEMPQSTQPKLLRVLEDLRVRRLGGKHEISVDARVLAATSQDLGTHLREELSSRLRGFQTQIPPR